MKPRKKSSAPPRNRDLARIHILAGEKGLNLPRDVYEAVIWTQGRQNSSGKLDQQGREKVIAHLEGLLRAQNPKHPALTPARGEPHNLDARRRGELQKIKGLLADSGKPWAYAEAMAKRMYGKDRIAFCDPGELVGIIAALHRQALKRLHAELEQQLGANWITLTAHAAAVVWGFDMRYRQVQKYPEPMSLVLRWYRGEIAPSCPWPPQAAGRCCEGCGYELMRRGLTDQAYHDLRCSNHSPDGEYPDGESPANMQA